MISYTQRNAMSEAIAAYLYAEFCKRGKTVWLDVKMHRRDEASMREAATHCRCLIAIVSGTASDSHAYFKRPFCLKELRWAVSAGGFVQPIVASEDKHKISDMMELVPDDLSQLRELNWEHIDHKDVEYFELGVSKILRQEKTWSDPTFDYSFSTLGVAMNASAAEIRKSYHRKALTCHPDRFSRSEWAAKNAEFQNLSECYAVCLEHANGTGWTEMQKKRSLLSNTQRAIGGVQCVRSAPIEVAASIRRADLRLALAKIKAGLTGLAEVERVIDDEEAFEADGHAGHEQDQAMGQQSATTITSPQTPYQD